MNKPKKTSCPLHGQMQRRETKYGALWACQAPGCTVKRWGSSTSLPGDDATRDARHAMHELFDPLWKQCDGPFNPDSRAGKNRRRKNAYRWLATEMKIQVSDMHFGMFTMEQCEAAKAIVERLLSDIAGPAAR